LGNLAFPLRCRLVRAEHARHGVRDSGLDRPLGADCRQRYPHRPDRRWCGDVACRTQARGGAGRRWSGEGGCKPAT